MASAHLVGLGLAVLVVVVVVVVPAGLEGLNTTSQRSSDSHHRLHRDPRLHQCLFGVVMTLHFVGHTPAAAAAYVSIDHCIGHHDALHH